MNSHRAGHSYRRRRPRILIANPAAHRIRRRISELRREIEQAQGIAARFQVEPTGLGEKQERLRKLEQELRSVI